MDAQALSGKLGALLGEAGWLQQDLESYQTDWLKRVNHPALGVARPCGPDQVAEIIQLAAQAGIPVIPQGGNTSLCGGSVPGSPGGIILSMSRMNRILAVDPVEFTATVEPGVVLDRLNDTLGRDGLFFPMQLGSGGSAQIGGLISTNAGGSHAMRHGMMQDLVLGLEVVLPDGEIWRGDRALIKDNAGYQLRRLFCGAEGTLGIITRAVLKLSPAPKQAATALLALPDFHAAVEMASNLRRRTGDFLSALEFFGETGLDMALRQIDGLDFPLESRSRVYMLLELTSMSSFLDLNGLLENELAEMFESGLVADGAVAANERQRQAFWRLREEMPEGQRLSGPQLKHDISVPVSNLAKTISSLSGGLREILPGVRINPFGHLGDGNIHFNLSAPESEDGFNGREAELSRYIYQSIAQAGGSFSAEHGLGRFKVGQADRLRGNPERRLMQAIKHAIDGENLMNPGVVVDN